MKKPLFLMFAFIAAIFFSGSVSGQEKAKTEISSVRLRGETVRFTLTSSKPFIFGNNKYILHIGGNEFSRYEQTKKNGKGVITFLIPSTDYDHLDTSDGVYLNYGQTAEGQDMEALSVQSRRCWSLGKFNKEMLTK